MRLPSEFQHSINQEFRKQSLDQLEKLNPSDVVVFDHQPIPENFTIVARVDDQTSNSIALIQDTLTEIDKVQYYYPLKQLHLTLLGNISSSTNPEHISQAVKASFKAPFKLTLFGLGSNQYCASMSAYPQNFSLAYCRKILREMIGDSGDDYSVHLPAFEKVGWINFMRYLQKPKERLLSELYAQRDTYFGEFVVREVSIYRNTSKVLAHDQSKLIDTITL